MELLRVQEPRTRVTRTTDKNHAVLLGSERVTYTTNVADSWNTNMISASWSITPPSNKTIIDRNIRVRAYIDVVTNVATQLGTNDAPRQFPLNSLVDVTTLQINGESISDNTGSSLHPMLCYGNDAHTRSSQWATSPAMPDSYQEYADWNTYGNARSPLSDWGEVSSEQSRGGFFIEQVSATNFRIVVTEPIFLSPLWQHGRQEEGMVNVNSLRLALRFKAGLDRVLSHASTGGAITSVTTTFYQAPELLINYLTPSLVQPIPELQVLPYSKLQHYIRDVPALAAGATTSITSDTIRLSVIPRVLYLYVPHSEATKTFNVSDSFLDIESVNMSWGNQSGLFASATPQQLYTMSVENGLNLDYTSVRKFRGSVIAIVMGKDIGLAPNEAPGVNGSYNVQVTLGVKNIGSASFTGTFFLSVLNDGTFSIGDNAARASIGNLTGDMVLMAREAPMADYHEIYGGNFFTSLKSIINKVARAAEAAAPAVGTALGQPAAGLAVQQIARGTRGLTGGRMVRG
tara:strand:+ start:10087 stop:11634 length:1548 start_codon:yes stop_codon:yes gene_type:complete